MTKVLDLGCGVRKKAGSLGVDCRKCDGVDLIHDLNVFPYPLEDNAFEMIHLDNTLEHLDHPVKVMEEIYRLLKPGGTAEIKVPYFRSVWAYIDPTHKNFFTTSFFSYFDPEHVHHKLYKMSEAKFKVERLEFDRGQPHKLFFKMIVWFANRHPVVYEHILSHIFPLNEITFVLKAVK